MTTLAMPHSLQICEDYSEEIMAADAIPHKRSIFVNPPYGQRK